ncbi:MAG: protein kinase domain-containing protein [Gemmatimonadales bacterium]
MAKLAKTWSAQVAEELKERYEIERVLGRGGMSVVYLARDRKLKRPVAIKVLDPSVSKRIGAERFLREVRITATLQHPHILPLLDSGTIGDIVYSVMPFVEGESLRDRLVRESPLPMEEALLYAREIAEALEYAHQRGIVHRDVKPENILISGGVAVIADFGIARASHLPGDANLTSLGVPLGTPAYMSPEQAAGRAEVDGRSDIYSLGCTLYEMLAGEPPFRGSMEEVIRRQREEQAPSVAAARPDVAGPVADLVQRAMAKEPGDRFESAGEFALALREVLGEPTRQPTPSDARATVGTATPAPPRRGSRPWPSFAGGWLVLVATMAALLALATVLMRKRPATQAAGTDTTSRSVAAPTPSLPHELGLTDSGRPAASVSGALARYDLTRPASEARLPPELNEASGVAVLPDGRVLVHGDEMAVAYLVDLASGRAERFLEAHGPARAGDYEDVAVVGQRLFMVASDGTLLEWNLARPADAPRTHPSTLGRRCDVESLAYVPPREAMLMICKRLDMAGAEGSVLGSWWSLKDARPDSGTSFRIDAKALADGQRQFSPSGAAWDPRSGHLVLVAGPDHRVAEVDVDGRVVAVGDLDAARHPQAEGIAFTPDGRLVIADEGRRSGARITVYAPTSQ